MTKELEDQLMNEINQKPARSYCDPMGCEQILPTGHRCKNEATTIWTMMGKDHRLCAYHCSLNKNVGSFVEITTEADPSSLNGAFQRQAARALAEVANLRNENTTLRTLLATCYAKSSLYHDGGELQDNRTRPFIDFKRDSLEEIQWKMLERVRIACEELGNENAELRRGGSAPLPPVSGSHS